LARVVARILAPSGRLHLLGYYFDDLGIIARMAGTERRQSWEPEAEHALKPDRLWLQHVS
jgi:hypothetical protein